MTEFKRISVEEAKKIIESKPVILVDIRDEKSFAAGHMKEAIHLDNTRVQSFIQEADLDQTVIVCCYHGNTSQPAAAWLVDQGFSDVYSLDGGFTQWQVVYPEECSAPGCDPG